MQTELSDLPITHILNKIRKYCPELSESSIIELRKKLTPIDFEKSSVLIAEGKRCSHAYFIEEGITRSYWNVNGEEITTSFSTEGDIVFSMDSVYYGKLSEEYVESLSPVKAFRISIADLHELVSDNNEIAKWWIGIHQDEYRRIHRSHKERLALSAKERYEAFREQFPDINRRTCRRYIASYLGITLSTLSRISRI